MTTQFQPRGERRSGVGLVEPARLGELGELVRDRVQPVVRHPAPVAMAPLEVQLVADLAQAEGAERIVLLDAGDQPKRLDERVAEPDVHQPRLVERDPQREMIEARAEAALGLVAAGLEERPPRTRSSGGGAANAPFSS